MKILVVGYGSAGRRHVDILKDITPSPRIDMVTSQDVRGRKRYDDLTKVGDLNYYDYIVIASETGRHYEHLLYIETKCKGKIILVEKPLFSVFREYRTTRNSIFVGYNLRFHPVIQRIKQLVADKRIIYVNVYAGQYLPSWRPERNYSNTYSSKKDRGGGVLLDLSHEIDYIKWLFGAIKEVVFINGKFSNLKIDSDDIASGIMVFKNGVRLNLSLDYLSRIPKREIIIHHEGGTIMADLIKNKIIISNRRTIETESFPCKRKKSYIHMHQSVIARANECATLEDGMFVNKIIDAIKCSSQTKKMERL